MRLIDADELKESLKDLKAEGYNQKYVKGLQDAIDYYFSQIIDDMPTVDVQPVKHGRWISYGRDNDWMKYYRCSSCSGEIVDASGLAEAREKYRFCPHCGCKQDLRGD